jgi:hypothetical protein
VIKTGDGEIRRRKTTTEECFTLDASLFPRLGRIPRPGWVNARLPLTWSNRFGEAILSVQYWVESLSSGAVILHLDVTPPGDVQAVDLKVRFETTQPHFGGRRWWFLCPLYRKNMPCERRVRKLYRPPLLWYFGCRSCLDLTYRSVQEHDKRIDELIKHPWKIPALVESKDPRKSLLALQACAKIYKWY